MLKPGNRLSRITRIVSLTIILVGLYPLLSPVHAADPIPWTEGLVEPPGPASVAFPRLDTRLNQLVLDNAYATPQGFIEAHLESQFYLFQCGHQL